MKIFYGTAKFSIDVTDICLSRLTLNNIITIPYGDYNRARYFTDPLDGTLKKIIILNNDKLTEYEDIYTIRINILNNTIHSIISNNNNNNIINNLKHLHSKLNIKYGNFNEELPEQQMVVKYFTGHEKVLEIGGNIGRNSLIIASILNNDNNFVTLESDVNIANQLKENRDLNNFKFHIESSALSKRTLIQRGWDTIPSVTLKEGYKWVNTINLYELQRKYNIRFDTLVLDCEGAFYYILMDMPEILDNINLILVENDYNDISKKQYVDNMLIKNKFYLDYVEILSNDCRHCNNNFFEAWKKPDFK